MEDVNDECPICFEKITKQVMVSMHCCSGQLIHVDCYLKSLPKCPFCRSETSVIFPVTIMKNDWPRVTKAVCIAVMFSACMSIAVISGSCNSTLLNQKQAHY